MFMHLAAALIIFLKNCFSGTMIDLGICELSIKCSGYKFLVNSIFFNQDIVFDWASFCSISGSNQPISSNDVISSSLLIPIYDIRQNIYADFIENIKSSFFSCSSSAGLSSFSSFSLCFASFSSSTFWTFALNLTRSFLNLPFLPALIASIKKASLLLKSSRRSSSFAW